MKFHKRVNGAISIFLVLIMIPMFTFAGTIVDFSRMNAANVVLSGASDLAMNAAMSDYNQALKDVYGIFAMSGSDEELNENLKRYFINSLTNIDDIDQSDSYTRQYINSLCSWFSTAGSTGETDFDTLLELGNPSFQATYVKGSEVYSVPVLKRQILEYMKYRAPVSMSTALLSKFGGFKGFSEQSRVLKKKVTYEKELDKVGDLCKDAYREIKNARDYKYTCALNQDDTENLDNIQKFREAYLDALSTAKTNYGRISELLVGIEAIEKYSSDANLDLDNGVYNSISSKASDVENAVTQEAQDAAGDDSEEPVTIDYSYLLYRNFDKILNEQSEFTNNQIGLSASCTGLDANGSYTYSLNINESFGQDLADFAQEVTAVKDSVGDNLDRASIIKIIQLREKITNWLSDTEKVKRIKAAVALRSFYHNYKNSHQNDSTFTYFHDNSQSQIDQYLGSIGGNAYQIGETIRYINQYIDKCKNKVNDLAVEANKKLNKAYNDINAQKLNYDACVTAMDALISGMESAESAGQAWNTAIDGVSDTGTKQTMKSDYNSTADLMKVDDAKALRDNVLKKNQSFFSDLETKIKTVKYCGKELATKYTNGGEGTDYTSEFSNAKVEPSSSSEENFTAAYRTSYNQFSCGADDNFLDFVTLLKGSELSNMTNAENNNQQFFSYLDQLCANDSSSSSGSEGARDALLDRGVVSNAENAANSNQEFVSGKNSASTESNQDIFAKMVTNNNGAISESSAKDSENHEDDAVSSNAGEVSDGQADLLEKIGNIAAAGRNKLYLVEYMRNMFSCYTTNIDPSADGNIQEPKDKTLSGIEINSDNNYYYGCECEYILWGGSPESAVTKTKVTIFGIRFVLNTIYAFTAPDIQSLTFQWAVAIAGWTGFGVPIVQSVLTIALSLAESVYDVEILCSGKSVPIYKSATTWAMSPKGLMNIARDAGQQAINDAAETAKSVLDENVTNIFDKIENCANDQISSLETTINNYIDQTVDNVTSQVKSFTITPLQNEIKGVLLKIDSTWNQETISSTLNTCLQNVKGQINGDTNSILYKCEIKSLEILESKIPELSEYIYSVSSVGNVSSQITEMLEEISNKFDTYTEDIEDAVKDKVSELSQSLQTEITNCLNSTEENAKDKLNQAITNFSDSITGKYNDALNRVEEGMPDSNTVGGNADNAKSATLSLNYKEYLYAFMLVGILANEDNMVARTGYLMQVNLSLGMNSDDVKDKYHNEDFNMTEMHTMVSVHSEADVAATFFGLFTQTTDSNGEASYSVDFSGDGGTTNRISYNGIIGY